ncbi:MAG: extracellular solute-binding protein [Muribaculaceae bacterium]|nr:extracellular solute-binding protein [Roseburia sp.]MCM1431098.1 extracellular solute-binding protein [Muribaculaceae bacterium]MCM1492521.1 extracellular solute-binding protein [Muribaculaceae bacterium]
MKRNSKKLTALLLAAAMILTTASCGQTNTPGENLIHEEENTQKTIALYVPMERSKPDVENAARSAFDKTVIMAEEKLGITVEYNTYTANDYQEKSYDDVALERIQNSMDDFYLLNPDVLQKMGEEGRLADLSGLACAQNLREVVRTANTVDGKLVGIPQEVVVYGLFVNKDMFDQYGLALPNTPEELLECCRVFKENGIETPIGANRWWLETFVFAQAYADLYNGGNTEEEIAALNSGERKYSDYMREGFTYLKKLIDLGYIDAKTAYTYEAIEGEGPDFLAQKTPIVMAYWGAANADTAYGKPDFNMQVIGFPSDRGQMPVMSMTGFSVVKDAKHFDDTLSVLEELLSDEALQVYAETNKVISPSKNVEVECIPALQPLNDLVNDGTYVLATNAGMKVEQWGNTCLIVRELLNGASVEECMAEFDRLQEETLAASGQ